MNYKLKLQVELHTKHFLCVRLQFQDIVVNQRAVEAAGVTAEHQQMSTLVPTFEVHPGSESVHQSTRLIEAGLIRL